MTGAERQARWRVARSAGKPVVRTRPPTDRRSRVQRWNDAVASIEAQMGQHIADLDLKIDALERQLLEQHKANAVSKLLAAIPGVGPITAMTMALTVNPANFESGRHFAAWIGLTPREHSTGGKHRLGRISKAGSERLRQLLVVGALAVIRYAKPGSKSATAWLLQLLERRPRKVAAVALANKMARVIWAMMARGEAYRRQPVAA
jgi:transposase